MFYDYFNDFNSRPIVEKLSWNSEFKLMKCSHKFCMSLVETIERTLVKYRGECCLK
jgi:hypothetical protein